MLTAYINATRNLLNYPSAATQLFSDAVLTTFINTARGQLAGEAECIRYQATLTVTPGTNVYNFSSLNTGTPATTGIQGVINVRSLRYTVGSGFLWIAPRAWEWFQLYFLNDAAPDEGPPTDWAQYGQGSAGGLNTVGSSASGSFYLNPTPDLAYVLTCDCVCFPIPLVADATVEAIPYLWTDAVPYFAAYLAYLSAQTGARQADAQRMFELYQLFLGRARQASNPSVNRTLYPQSPDPTLLNKLGTPTRAQQ